MPFLTSRILCFHLCTMYMLKYSHTHNWGFFFLCFVIEILLHTFISCECRSVMSDSLWPHVLYSPWTSPGQNTGVGSLSLLQGIFPTEESNWSLLHQGRFISYITKINFKKCPKNILKKDSTFQNRRYAFNPWLRS